MAKKKSRRRTTKDEELRFRVTPQEKSGFYEAAELAGETFSEWARERLRRYAKSELEAAGVEVPFAKKVNPPSLPE